MALHLTADALRDFSVVLLKAAGVPGTAAALQAEMLVEAELRGRPSHGVQRLPVVIGRIRAGLTNPSATGLHTWRGAALLEVDGGGGLGPAVAVEALDPISERARSTGVATAVISNANHLGMLGWYVERIALRGQIALAFSTSEALVHPWGGTRAEVGSNPIAIGVPADPRPVVIDMATASTSRGLVQHYAEAGRQLEAGWAVDSDGEPTLDASAALDGAISPFGGPKGYALAIGLEAMIGVATGTSFGRDVLGTLDVSHPVTKGDVLVVIEPSDKQAPGSLRTYLDEVRNSPRRDSSEPVAIPGDRGHERRDRALRDGIEVPTALIDRLEALLAELTPAGHPVVAAGGAR